MAYPNPSIWMTGREISKSIRRVPTLPTDDHTYGVIVKFDFTQPTDTFTIEISHLTDSQVHTYMTEICTIGTLLSVTDDKGKAWVGELIGVSTQSIKGTNLNSMRLSMFSDLVTDN